MLYRTILGDLVARTAVHVGSGAEGDTSDALFRRDAQGQGLIPGTAIAGALRALATRLAPRLRDGSAFSTGCCRALIKDPESDETCPCPVCHLFGNLNPSEEDAPAKGGRAARLWVFDARPAAEARLTVRDMVGIDRASRVAARDAAAKFDVEVVQAGTVFRFRLELDDDPIPLLTAEAEDLLAATLAEWEQGRASLGGRVARGLGAFHLNRPRLVSLDLGRAEVLLRFLAADEPWDDPGGVVDLNWVRDGLARARARVSAAPAEPAAVARSFATFSFPLQAEGPLLTNDATAAGRGGFDHAALFIQPICKSRPVLAGSGLRGVLRAQAERIARTLALRDAGSLVEFGRICPACDPLSNPHEKPQTRPLASCDALLRAKFRRQGQPADSEPAAKELCLACRLFGSPRNGSQLLVEDAEFAEGTELAYKVIDFLAIDRFTGGGRDGAKFDALALWRPRFDVRLHLDNPQPWELGWLVLVLRDLAEGMLQVGFGASKGFGKVTVPQADLALGFLTEADFLGLSDGTGATFTNSGPYRVFHAALFDQAREPIWTRLAQPWVEAFLATLRDFKRTAELTLQADHYFSPRKDTKPTLAELYPHSL